MLGFEGIGPLGHLLSVRQCGDPGKHRKKWRGPWVGDERGEREGKSIKSEKDEG